MRVLEDREHRLARSEALQLFDERLQGLPLQLPGVEIELRIRRSERERQERGDQRHRGARVVAAERKQRLEFFESYLGGIGALESGGALEQSNDRIKRGVGVIGGAVVADRHVPVAELLAQRTDDAGLAHAGLAGEENHLPLACLRGSPAIEQQGDFVLASDQRGEARSVHRLETALEATLPQYAPHRHRLAKSFHGAIAAVLKFEQFAQEIAGLLADDDATWVGGRLQTRGQIGRLADDRVLVHRSLAGQVADDDDSGRNSDARRQRLAGWRPQPPNRFAHR
jgi:hypothetical protein